MGWLYTGHDRRSDLVEEILDDLHIENEETETTVRPLRHCYRGNVLWVLAERTEPGVVDDRVTQRFILCYLLAKEKGYGWGYKDIDESMGPGYVTCPLGYIEEATEPVNEFSRMWRQAVREYHANR